MTNCLLEVLAKNIRPRMEVSPTLNTRRRIVPHNHWEQIELRPVSFSQNACLDTTICGSYQ